MLLRLVTFSVVAALLSACSPSVDTKPSNTVAITLPPIGVQLHSVRDAVSEDFEGTLTSIAAMGFDGVEFAGRYGRFKDKPHELKAFLDELGLQVSGAHIGFKALKQNPDKHLNFFKAMGSKLVIIPHDHRIDNPDKIDEFISELKPLIKKTEQMELTLGYHNHAKEFKPFKDSTFWDYLAQNTPQSFALQLDVGWIKFAGANPVEYVKRYPNRTLTSHYKIRSYQGKPSTVPKETKIIIGQTGYDWAELAKTNAMYGGTQWIVIEQEEYPEGMTPLQAVHASKKGLDAALKPLYNSIK